MKNFTGEKLVEKFIEKLAKTHCRRRDEIEKQKVLKEQKVRHHHFCTPMGIIHEEASNEAAHVLGRILLKPGFEFKTFCLYGADEFYEFTTILVNAVGLSHLVIHII